MLCKEIETLVIENKGLEKIISNLKKTIDCQNENISFERVKFCEKIDGLKECLKAKNKRINELRNNVNSACTPPIQPGSIKTRRYENMQDYSEDMKFLHASEVILRAKHYNLETIKMEIWQKSYMKTLKKCTPAGAKNANEIARQSVEYFSKQFLEE